MPFESQTIKSLTQTARTFFGGSVVGSFGGEIKPASQTPFNNLIKAEEAKNLGGLQSMFRPPSSALIGAINKYQFSTNKKDDSLGTEKIEKSNLIQSRPPIPPIELKYKNRPGSCTIRMVLPEDAKALGDYHPPNTHSADILGNPKDVEEYKKQLGEERLSRSSIVAIDQETGEIIGLIEPDNSASTAFVAWLPSIYDNNGPQITMTVQEKYQGNGVGTEMRKICLDVVKLNGLDGILSKVAGGKDMMHILKKMGAIFQQDSNGDIWSWTPVKKKE